MGEGQEGERDLEWQPCIVQSHFTAYHSLAELQRGITKVELQPWVRKIHTDGDKLLPHGTGNTAMRSELSSGRHDGQGSVQDTGGGRSNGITEKEDSDGAALTGGGGGIGDHGPTAFTHSSSLPQWDGGEHLRSLLQREGASKKEIQVILRAFQEERRRNHSRYGDLARLSTQPALLASPGNDAVRTEIAPSSRKPISEPPVPVHTPASTQPTSQASPGSDVVRTEIAPSTPMGGGGETEGEPTRLQINFCCPKIESGWFWQLTKHLCSNHCMLIPTACLQVIIIMTSYMCIYIYICMPCLQVVMTSYQVPSV